MIYSEAYAEWPFRKWFVRPDRSGDTVSERDAMSAGCAVGVVDDWRFGTGVCIEKTGIRQGGGWLVTCKYRDIGEAPQPASIIDDREALVEHLRRLVRLQRSFIERAQGKDGILALDVYLKERDADG